MRMEPPEPEPKLTALEDVRAEQGAVLAFQPLLVVALHELAETAVGVALLEQQHLPHA